MKISYIKNYDYYYYFIDITYKYSKTRPKRVTRDCTRVRERYVSTPLEMPETRR